MNSVDLRRRIVSTADAWQQHGDDALRTRLLQVYVALGRYESASAAALDQALWALGRADGSGGVAAAEVAGGDGSVRGDAARVDGDSFYWMESEDGG